MSVVNFKEAAEKHAKEAKENIVRTKTAKIVNLEYIKARDKVITLCEAMEQWLVDDIV